MKKYGKTQGKASSPHAEPARLQGKRPLQWPHEQFKSGAPCGGTMGAGGGLGGPGLNETNQPEINPRGHRNGYWTTRHYGMLSRSFEAFCCMRSARNSTTARNRCPSSKAPPISPIMEVQEGGGTATMCVHCGVILRCARRQ